MWKTEVHSEKDKSLQSPSTTYKLLWIDKETSAYVLLIPQELLQFLFSFLKGYLFLFIRKEFQYRHDLKKPGQDRGYSLLKMGRYLFNFKLASFFNITVQL